MNKKIPDVLVLNKAYVPVHIVDWKKAMSLIYQETCRALDRDFIVFEYKDWLSFSVSNAESYPKIHTVSHLIAIPEIIVLRDYDRLPQRDVKYSRQTIFSRDNFCCAFCGQRFERKDLTIDHIFPKSKGGKTTWENTISACKACNSKKADRTLEESGMKLLFKPKKPKWISPISKLSPNHPCKSWKHFLNRALVDIGD